MAYGRDQAVPRQVDSGWMRPDHGQKIILATTLVMVIAAEATAGWWLAITVVVIGGILYAPLGSSYRGPVYNRIARRIEGWFMRRRRGRIYSVNLKDALLEYDSESDQAKVKPRHPFGAKLRAIPFTGRSGQVQLLPFFSTGEYITMVLLNDGHPMAMTSDEPQRFLWDNATVDAIKRALNTTNEPIDLSLFCMSRPPDITEQARYVEDRWHPDFREPEADSAEHRVGLDDLEGSRHLYATGTRMILGVAVRMKRPKKWKEKKLDSLRPDDIEQAPIVMVMRTLLNNMEGGLTNVRLPSVFELNELGYLLFNAVNVDPFYEQQAKDVAAEEAGELSDVNDAMTLKQGPWPGSLRAENNCIIANQTRQTTFMVSGFERSSYPVGFFDGLLNQDCPFIYSEFIQTLPFSKGMRRARMKRRVLMGFFGAKHIGGSDDDMQLEEREAMDEAAAGHHALFNSRSRSILMRIQMTVAAADHDREGLELNAAKASAVLSNHGMSHYRYLDEPYQLDPILAAVGILEE